MLLNILVSVLTLWMSQITASPLLSRPIDSESLPLQVRDPNFKASNQATRITNIIDRSSGIDFVAYTSLPGPVGKELKLPPCALGQPVDCILAGLNAVFEGYLKIYKASNCNNDSTASQNAPGSCSPKSVSRRADYWSGISSSVANGVQRDVEYRSDGKVHGLRVVQNGLSAEISRRQSADTADVDGYAISYFWERNMDPQTWSTLDMPDNLLDLASYIVNGTLSIACASMLSWDLHHKNTGILSIGTQYKEIVWADSTLQNYLNICWKWIY